jgi:hypothetical protein
MDDRMKIIEAKWHTAQHGWLCSSVMRMWDYFVYTQQYSDKHTQASSDLWDKFSNYFERWALNVLTTVSISKYMGVS